MRIVLKEAPKISPINQTAIDQLKKLLSMAESGELQSIAYVGEMLCGDIFRGYSSGVRPFRMIGGIEDLKHAIMRDLLD